MSVGKVEGSGKVDVDVLNSEKKSSGDNDEKTSELPDFILETGSIAGEK